MGVPIATRPLAAAGGTLSKTPLIHLLLYGAERGLSGTIAFASPDGQEAEVLFASGRPAKVRTSQPVATLGRVLVDLGALSAGELARSVAELTAAKRNGPVLHGQLLLSAGAITEDSLVSALREQVARKLRHVAALPAETAYTFYDGFDALGDYGASSGAHTFDPLPIIWRILRESPPAAHVETALNRVRSSLLRLSRTASLARLELGPDHHAAAELLGIRPMRVSELAQTGALGEKETDLLVYLLLATKQVDVLRPVGDPPAPRASRPFDAGDVSPRPSSPVSAPEAPLRSFTPQPSFPPSPSLRGGFAPQPALPPSPSLRGGFAPPPSTLSAELAARWLEIGDRAGTIDRSDYFAMLGVARDATHDAIESAFFALARKWHPDRLAAELGPMRDACSRVFARMSEAHKTLADDARRAEYVALMADGSGSPEMQESVAKVIDAATAFQKAEVCLRRNALAQAEELCRKAIDGDPTQPEYLAMLAWLIAQKPENQSPEKTKESLAMLDRAIEMNARCEKALFWRGMLQKRLGRGDAAYRDFKRAVEVNARNIDAAREVRLYRMRRGRSSSAPPAASAGRSVPAPPRSSSTAPPQKGAKGDEAKPNLLDRLFKR